mmetsp:Transcript_12518/g.22746  ORF Transcript_12518/g.22746 Transcript_12518/m.22746 type:complete len:519 (+) Transcript_12518:33-1589(+)
MPRLWGILALAAAGCVGVALNRMRGHTNSSLLKAPCDELKGSCDPFPEFPVSGKVRYTICNGLHCPHEDGICCDNKQTCCPYGFTCDPDGGSRCVKTRMQPDNCCEDELDKLADDVKNGLGKMQKLENMVGGPKDEDRSNIAANLQMLGAKVDSLAGRINASTDSTDAAVATAIAATATMANSTANSTDSQQDELAAMKEQLRQLDGRVASLKGLMDERGSLQERIRRRELEQEMLEAARQHDYIRALRIQAELMGKTLEELYGMFGNNTNSSNVEGQGQLSMPTDLWLSAESDAPDPCSATCGPPPCADPCAPIPDPTPASDKVTSKKSCEELGWTGEITMKRYGSPSICAKSDINGTGCSGKVSHHTAKEICEAHGARLCSIHELEYDNTRGSGCGYDDQSTWSLTPCKDGYYAGKGSSGYRQPDDQKSCSGAEELKVARCCADATLKSTGGGNKLGGVGKLNPNAASDQNLDAKVNEKLSDSGSRLTATAAAPCSHPFAANDGACKSLDKTRMSS